MKLLFILSCILAVTAPQAFDTASIQGNTWYRIPTSWSYLPGTGTFDRRGWCTMRYNPVRGTVLFMEGNNSALNGGSCIYANGLYEFNIETDSVVMHSLMNWWCKASDTTYQLPGSPVTPRPRHTSSQFAYVPSEDRVYIADGATGVGKHPKDLWGYSFTDSSWTPYQAAPGSDSSNPAVLMGGCMVYKANTHELYYFSNNGVRAFNLTQRSWSSLTTKRIKGHGAYDTLRNRFVFFGAMTGSVSNTLVYYDVAARRLDTVPVTGAWPPARQFAAIEYSPRHDIYILHCGQDLHDTWFYDPRTLTWAEVTTPTAPPNSLTDIMVTYDTDRDLLVRFDNELNVNPRLDMWVLRPDPSIIASLEAPVRNRDSFSLAVRPNPATTAVTIRAGIRSGATADIYHVSGRLIARAKLGANGVALWDASAAAPGLYLVRVTAGSAISEKKLAIVH